MGEEGGHGDGHADRGRRGEVQPQRDPGADDSPRRAHEARGVEDRPPGARDGGACDQRRACAARARSGILRGRRLGDPRAVGHEEHGEDGADQVGRGRAGGRAQHVVAAGHTPAEHLDEAVDPLAEVGVAGDLAEPVRAGLHLGRGFRSSRLEAVERLLHVVEHEVRRADADRPDGEEGEQDGRDPPDVLGEAVDEGIEQHRGDRRRQAPGQRAMGSDEHADAARRGRRSSPRS